MIEPTGPLLPSATQWGGEPEPSPLGLLAAVLVAALASGAAVAGFGESLLVALAFAAMMLGLILLWKSYLVLDLLILSATLLAYRVPLGGVNITPFRGMVVVALGIILFRHFLRHRSAARVRSIASAGVSLALMTPLILVLGLNVLRSEDPDKAQFNLLSILMTLATVLLFSYLLSEPEQVRGAMRAQVVSGVFLALYGLYELFYYQFWGSRPELPFPSFVYEVLEVERTTSSLSHPLLLRVEGLLNDGNILGSCLAVSVLFALALFMESGHRIARWVYGVAMALCLLCLLATLSRSAILAVVLGLGWFFFGGIRGRGRGRRLLQGALLLGSVAMVGAVLYSASEEVQLYTSTLGERFGGIGAESRRLELLESGLEIWRSEIWLGVGTGNLPSHGHELSTAHSSYLTWLAETGIVGAVALLLFLFPVLRAVASVAIRKDLSPTGRGIAGAGLALLVFELFYDTLFYAPTTIVVLAIVFSYGISRLGRSRGAEPASAASIPAR